MSLDLPPLPPFDEYDPGAMVVVVGERNKLGRHVVTVRRCGVSHTDTIDADSSIERQRFREKVVGRFSLQDEAHEWLEEEIQAKAKIADAGKHNSIFTPSIVMLDTVAPMKVEWLVPNKIALGKNNLWAGVPGIGKSLGALAIAACESTGRGFFGPAEKSREPGGVVILTQEDDAADTIVPRLNAHGADLSRIALVQGLTEKGKDGKVIRGIDLLHDIDMVIEAIKQVENCRLIVVDTINDYISSATDSHKNSDTRAVLNPMAAMASDFGVANLLISHFRKGESGSAVNAVMGSIAFVGQCRVCWAITRCPTNPKRRLMTAIKNNLAEDTAGLAFHIEPSPDDPTIPVVSWESEPLRMSADQAIAQLQQPRGRKPVQREDAADWLARALADGPQPAAEITEAGEAAGHKAWTLRRAYKQLDGVKPYKRGFGPNGAWMWALPIDDSEDDTNPTSQVNCNLSHLSKNHEDDAPQREHICTVSPMMTNTERQEWPDDFDAINAECNGHGPAPF